MSAPSLLRKALSVHAGSSLEPLIGGGRNALLGSVITGVSADVALQLTSMGLGSELSLPQVLAACTDSSPVPEQSAAVYVSSLESPVVELQEYFWLPVPTLIQVSSGITVTDVGRPGAAQVVPGAKLRRTRLLV